jgi:pimeloyl-ACP methyl ester carboxylesterase
MSTSRARVRERLIRVSGEVAALEELGDGPPVVLLASMMIRACSYRPLTRALARRFHVLTVELPGSGRGSRLDAPWDFAQHARWCAELLPALGLESARVIGHSNAGAVALVLGAIHPERLSRLVLVDSVGVAPLGTVGEVIRRRAQDVADEPGFNLKAAGALLYNSLLHTATCLEGTLLAVTEDLTGYARRIRVPTLVAWGARDHTTPVRDARVLHGLVPGAELYVSATGSHDWLVTEAEAFVAAVGGFLG